jgi:DMSO/TMAO reductase YedYZ molybdopterin-dependent catalytic subunit
MTALRFTPISRRDAVQRVLLAGAGMALLPDAAWPAGAQPSAQRELVPFTDIPETFATKRTGTFTLPGQDALGIDLRTVGWKTPVNETFVVSHYNTPTIDAAQWRLAITGNGRPMTLSLDDLKRRPRVQHTATFECGGNRDGVLNRMLSNATWAGCSLKALLQEARPASDVLDVVFWGADRGKETIRGADYEMHFARAMALDDALASDAILAYEVDGAPIPVVHGFPVRLLVPGWYGVSNVKWIERIELSPRRFMGKFMGRDYVTIMGRQAGDRVEYTETSVTRILVKSAVGRLTRPAAGTTGAFGVHGIAITDGTPLQRVEVQLDGGPWQPARLEPNGSKYAWTFWSLDVTTLTPGAHTVASRATDRLGRTQPADLSLKKSNWENNAIWTRKFQA